MSTLVSHTITQYNSLKKTEVNAQIDRQEIAFSFILVLTNIREQ